MVTQDTQYCQPRYEEVLQPLADVVETSISVTRVRTTQFSKVTRRYALISGMVMRGVQKPEV